MYYSMNVKVWTAFLGVFVCTVAGSELGTRCLKDTECDSVRFSRCWRQKCVCQDFHVQINKTTCLPPTLLGFPCADDVQCNIKVTHSACVRGACRCSVGFATYRRHICLKPAAMNDVCHTDEQCRIGSRGSTCKFLIPRVVGRCTCRAGRQLHGNKCLKKIPVLGALCLNPTDCGDIAHAQCSPGTDGPGRCECAAGYTGSDDRTRCRPVFKEALVEPASLGLACSSSSECRAADPNSRCDGGRCECVIPTTKCRADHAGCYDDTFQCRGSGRCISWYFVCDGERHCDDGSDEKQCLPLATSHQFQSSDLTLRCPRQTFRCSNDRRCVSRAMLCNGADECGDGSDELGCREGTLARLSNLQMANNASVSIFSQLLPRHMSCPEGSLACESGGCRPASDFCNAIIDCADASDEPYEACVLGHPSATCPFRCFNNRCRSTAVLCSGRDGCGDGSDELRCKTCKCASYKPDSSTNDIYQFYG